MSNFAVFDRFRRISSSAAFAWLYCLWIVVIAMRFCLRARAAALDFFCSASYVEWFAGLFVVALLAAACALLRPGLVAGTCFVLLSTAAGAMLSMGHLLAPFALAISMLLVTACAGRLMLRPLFGGSAEDWLLFLCGLPAGITLFALITLAVGLVGLLTPRTCWIIFGAGTAAVGAAYGQDASLPHLERAGVRARAWLSKNLRECSRETALLLILMSVLAFLNLIWAAAPEIEYDALNYHLAVPRLYLEHHRVLELPFFQAYHVRNLEMLFTWIMALGGAEAVKFAVFALSLAAAAASYALGSLVFSKRAGLWAAALFYTTPLVGWESSTVYIDTIIALFVACAFIAIAWWFDTRHSGALIAAALLAGAGVGSKLNATYAFLATAPVMVWGTIGDCARRVPETIRRLLYALAAFAIGALPCYALFWWYTGNPTFPFLNGLFQSPKWYMENIVLNRDALGTPRTLSFLTRFPFRLTLDTRLFAERMNGVLGIGILTAFPFAALMAGSRKAARLLVLSALVYFVLLFYSFQIARFVLPILPVVAVLGAGLALQLTESRAAEITRVCLFIAVTLQFPVLVEMRGSFQERFPLAVASGAEDREHFLQRALPGYSATMYLNQVSGPNDQVLTLGMENLRFYAKPPLQAVTLTTLTDPLRQTAQPMREADLHQILRNAGILWLFLRQSELVEKPPSYYPFLAPDFLTHYTILEFTDGTANVYRLVERGKVSPSTANKSFSLAASGVNYQATTSESGPVAVGYGTVQPGAGNTTPTGIAVFSYRSNGVLVNETAVPASPLLQSGRIYAESSGAVRTSIAIANPSDQDAAISFYFTDRDGVNFNSGTTTLRAHKQTAAFLDQAPYHGSEAAQSFTFTSSVRVGVIALRSHVNERSDPLLTTLPVAPLSPGTPPSTGNIILPHYAAGGGWTTQVLLVNPTDQRLSGTVNMDATYPYAIAPRSSVKITSANSDLLRTGSVVITPAQGSRSPIVSSVFRLVSNGITVTETGIATTGVAPSFRVFAESNSGQHLQTGIAIANTAASVANIQFELLKLDGKPSGYTGSTTLGPDAHMAMFLNEIPGLKSLPSSFRGVLHISSNTSISAIGLRTRYNERGDFLISTTPAIADNAPSSTDESVFPQVVSGSGYTTEFILMNPAGASQGTLSLSSQTGTELPLFVP